MPFTSQSASIEWYDAVVLGTGQGGTPLAKAFAAAGRRVAIVERGPLGGSCVNFGCTPTKTLVASARVAALARRASDFGVDAGPVRVDFRAVQARQRRVVEQFRDGVAARLEDEVGVELVRGHGRFVGPDAVEVLGADGRHRRLSAPLHFIDTGTRAVRPPIPGLDEVDVLDPRQVVALDALPTHLVVIGGGYVGVEYAQLFRRFGARVTLVEAGPRLLAHEDADVSAALTNLLREEGVEVLPGARVARVERGGPGELRVHVDDRVLSASHLLLAAGRRPNTDDLGLKAAGVETDARGFVRVDGRLQTSVPGVYALGDVVGGPAFTHVAYDHYRVLCTNLLEGGDATIHGRPVPYVVFTDPELGRIGLTKHQAPWARVARLPMKSVARAIESDETRGFIEALVGPDDRVVGATVLGPYAGELLAVFEVAMMAGLPYTALRDGVFAHPTFAEALNNLFQAFRS